MDRKSWEARAFPSTAAKAFCRRPCARIYRGGFGSERAARLDLAFLLYEWRWPSPPDPALPPVQEPPPSPACERVEADAGVYAALDASS
ncbi:MAG: hypothetical protein GY772_01795, partial [bacterium]|nr:hypothetical protein [bacterium]